MTTIRSTFVALALAAAVGCSSSQSGGPGTGGAPGSGGLTGSGDSTGTGGMATSGGTTGSSGGSTGTGGIQASGGASGGAQGGMAGASTGSGGAAGGAAGHASGGAGGGAMTAAPKPSPGCSKGTGRPAGGQVSVANTSLYMFPTSYDGTKPFPLLIALHACGNPNTEFVSITNNTSFADNYVRSFPNTPDSGQCWSNYSGDVSRILSQYDEVMNNYCIDENRVFAIAHSSGSQMLVNILSHKSDAQHLNLKAISPVAADPYKPAAPMPVLYIDGQHDNQRSADSATNPVADFRAANMCASTSTTYDVMTCNSTDPGHPLVHPGCIIYDKCTVPTIWCSHDDPSYSGTEHGIPCFAIGAMIDFFASLP